MKQTKARPLLFLAAVSPDVFLPECLAEGGRDLFRVVMELLRTIRRHGVLLNLDGGVQFDGHFVRRLNEDEWTRSTLEAHAQREETNAGAAQREAEAAEREADAARERLRQISGRLGTTRTGAGLARRLDAEKQALVQELAALEKKAASARDRAAHSLRRAERYRKLPAEFGTWYTQMLEVLANDGRMVVAPRAGTRLLDLPPSDFASTLRRTLEAVRLAPDFILVPPGFPPSVDSISLGDLAQQDLLTRLSTGDAVVQKMVSDYRASLSRVVRTAHHRMILIDPYLSGLAGSTRYEPFIQLLLELVAERPDTLPAIEVEFHANELGNEFNAGARTRMLFTHEKKPDMRRQYIESIHDRVSDTIRKYYYRTLKERPDLAERLRRITITYWREVYDFQRAGSGRVVDADAVGERFHDRYFLADHAGVEMPYGLDCIDSDKPVHGGDPQRSPNHTILKLLSRDTKEFVEARFRWSKNAAGLPYESVSGPMKVELRNRE